MPTPKSCPDCHVYHLPGDYCDPGHAISNPHLHAKGQAMNPDLDPRLAEFARRVEAGEMTAEHVTRSLRPGSNLAVEWQRFFTR